MGAENAMQDDKNVENNEEEKEKAERYLKPLPNQTQNCLSNI